MNKLFVEESRPYIKSPTMKGVCRVCLTTAEDHNTYRVVNKTLEHTYDVISRVKLQRADWPTTLCCVCVSQLRRCRRFIETVRESNDALEQWYQNHTHTDWNFMERPLVSFNKSKVVSMDIFEPQIKVKQEPLETDDVSQRLEYITEVKQEITYDDYNVQKDPIQTDDAKTVSVVIKRSTSDYEDNIEGDKQSSNESDNEAQDDVKHEVTVVVDEISETVRSTSNIEMSQTTLDESVTVSGNSGKHIMLDDDNTDDPELKRMTPNTVNPNPMISVTVPVQFSCPHCTFTTLIKSSLKQHLRTHTEIMPFVCDKCDYKSKQKYLLRTHLKTHTADKKFLCDKCDYKCIRRDDLKKHFMIHTGEKPFACDKCDYKCRKKSGLNTHLMTHSGIKPYSCDKCDYKCIQKGHLKIHSMIHSGEKPFSCDKCDYKCILKKELTIHTMLHTGIKPFACDKCDYKCRRNSDLKKHKRTTRNHK